MMIFNQYITTRIKAVNKSSKGHWNYSIPSEPSDSMIAKIRYSEQRLFFHTHKNTVLNDYLMHRLHEQYA